MAPHAKIAGVDSNESMAGPKDAGHSLFLRASKRLVDVAISLFALIFFSWLYVLLWLGVLLTSGGPAIYSQTRYGKNGKVFRCYKFRSMVKDANKVLEEYLRDDPVAMREWIDFQKLENDPRVTRFGAFIRKTSLDEFPQFWNVLIGDMSIVGPRPCMVEQRSLYGANWHYYCAVRPGITGLWQVSGRNNLSFQMRVALDINYVQKLSVANDIKIFFKTIRVVLSRHGSR